MQILIQDLRYAVRMLLKKPAFTLVAIVTLALGIGANTAIFSIVNSVLLRPLPFQDSERLMRIGQQFPKVLAAAGEPKFLFWREHNQSFESMAAYAGFGAGGNLAGSGEPEYVDGLRVSADFFRVLGVNPAIGRSFTLDDDQAGAAPVAILSDSLWRRRFAADDRVVGQSVLLNGKSLMVVGVMPRDFTFFSDYDLFVPFQPSLTGDPNPNATVIGKLKTGVTEAQARSDLESLANSYRDLYPKAMQPGESVGLQPYQDLFTSNARELLWILLAAVGFLLLIACANVANLHLARAEARRKEIAVKRALGASGWRVIRQLLTEGILLSLAGAAAGLLLAIWCAQLLMSVIPRTLVSRSTEISLDWRVLAFALGLAIVTGIVFGLVPALQARRINVNTTLKESPRQGGAPRARFRSALVIFEIALSLVLLVGATLLIRTFINLNNVAPGFDANNVLTFRLSLKGEKYGKASAEAIFFQEALERIGRLPGVEAVAVTNVLPLQAQFNMPVVFPDSPDNVHSTQFRLISPHYFSVMKTPLKKGRAFTDADRMGATPVALVNERFVQSHLNGDPFTQQLMIGRDLDDTPRQIVGVVGDTKQFGLDKDAPATVFLPIAQVPDKLMTRVKHYVSTYVTVRTTVPPLSLSEPIKQEIAAIDPTLALANIRPLDQVVERSVALQRFNMLLVRSFAGLGLLLAAVGIYGVVSYSVAQRTNELGIRIALGARSYHVLRLIMSQSLLLALVGVAIGLGVAFALTRLISSLLFGVTPNDSVTLVVVSVLVLAAVLLASYLPARRATRVDPMVALRYE